ncbi:MAG: hypothetical protein EOP04_25370 [Proteobacteria bacterium]|nr:MAG: hypothetical protein EOP04_25370 [Pseudomonadota bacterium]
MCEIAWETEVWIADATDQLIHFNGECYLAPYDDKSYCYDHIKRPLRLRSSDVSTATSTFIWCR